MLTVTLPWPPRVLWSNARPHWAQKARAVLEARELAWEVTLLAAWAQGQSSETIDLTRAEIPVEVIYHQPTRGRRDRDNKQAACKAYFDGIADCLGIDDARFCPTAHQGSVVRGGQVVFRIH